MDLVFVYEDKVAVDVNGNYYIGSAFSQEVFDRYLQHFEHITLIMRKSDVKPDDSEALARMNRINTERITIEFLPNPTESLRSFFSIKLRREYKKKIIDNITPDRAVIIRAPSTSGTIAARYCKKIGKKFLVEAVGCPWDSLWNHSLRGKVMAPFAWRNFRYTMKNATYAVYVTSEFLQRRYPTMGLSSAISDVELQPMSDDILKRRLEKIRTHSGRIRIATAAAVNVAFKGQRFVIEALAKLKNEGNTSFEYHLAGGGDNSALKNLADKLGVSEQVVFEGSLPHDEMFRWLDDVDIYVQPSLQEGLPRAVVEAMSRGLPAFGASTGGIPELLGSKSIFPRKNPDAIKDKLLSVDNDAMETMAVDNFAHAKQFQKEILEKKRFDFYSEFARAAKE